MKPIFQSNSRTRRHRQAPAPETQAEQEPFFSAETKSPEQQAMPFFQAKATQGVKMGRPDDPFEREADTVADKVVNQKAGATTNAGQSITPVTGGSLQRIATPEEDKMPGTNDARMAQDKEIQEKPEPGSPMLQKMDAPKEEDKPVQKMGDKEEEPVQKMDAPKEEENPVQKMGDKEEEPMQAREEEEPVQAKASSGTTAAQPNLGARLSQKKGSGKPLPKSVRTEMERGIGADFSGVRVHTDADAVDMNREVHAQAFTHGQDVYFNSGKYNPEQTEGKRLLAHELTHVVQQGGGKAQIQRHMQKSFPWEGVITNTWSASLRATPNHSNFITNIPKGTPVQVLNQVGNWLSVKVFLGKEYKTGFVSQELVSQNTKKIEDRNSFENYVEVGESTGWLFGEKGVQVSSATNIADLVAASLLNYDIVYLKGNLLAKIKIDPAMIELEESIISLVQAEKDMFGKKPFYKSGSETKQFGGLRWSAQNASWTSLSRRNPALHLSTWKVGFRELTWALRGATIRYWADVDPKGRITISYKLYDKLDLDGDDKASGPREKEYKFISDIGEFFYHKLAGGNKNMQTRAEWTSVR